MENFMEPTVEIPQRTDKKFKFSVTSRYGRLVDLHFGHANEFRIHETNGTNIVFLETRQADNFCIGMADDDERRSRQDAVVDVIANCDALITMRIGPAARGRLHDRGIHTVEYFDTVEQGLLYALQQLLKHGSDHIRHFEFRKKRLMNANCAEAEERSRYC